MNPLGPTSPPTRAQTDLRLDTRPGFRLPQQLGGGRAPGPRPLTLELVPEPESAGSSSRSERRYDDEDALPGSAPGRDQTPQGRGGAGLLQREVRRPRVTSGDSEQSAGHEKERTARLMKCEVNRPTRENGNVGRHCKLGTCESRSRESGGPKGAGPPWHSGWSFPDSNSFTDALL